MSSDQDRVRLLAADIHDIQSRVEAVSAQVRDQSVTEHLAIAAFHLQMAPARLLSDMMKLGEGLELTIPTVS